MLKKIAIGIGAIALAALTSISSAIAHSPRATRVMLEDKGFRQISFIDRTLPLYKLTACKGSSKFRINVTSDGEITRCDRISRCGRSRFNDRVTDDYRAPDSYRTIVPTWYRNRTRRRFGFGRRYRDGYTVRYGNRF